MKTQLCNVKLKKMYEKNQLLVQFYHKILRMPFGSKSMCKSADLQHIAVKTVKLNQG